LRASAAGEKTAFGCGGWSGAAAVTASILRLMIAALLGGILALCSLAIERTTDNKKTAVLREYPQEMTVKGNSSTSRANAQFGSSIGPGAR
jgi:hypothetical protein